MDMAETLVMHHCLPSWGLECVEHPTCLPPLLPLPCAGGEPIGGVSFPRANDGKSNSCPVSKEAFLHRFSCHWFTLFSCVLLLLLIGVTVELSTVSKHVI
jgi:hypothetical protein